MFLNGCRKDFLKFLIENVVQINVVICIILVTYKYAIDKGPVPIFVLIF